MSLLLLFRRRVAGAPHSIYPSGIPSAEAFGTPTVLREPVIVRPGARLRVFSGGGGIVRESVRE